MDNGISYEEYLDKNGTLTYTVVGVSMLPLLHQHKDLFTVRKKGKRRCAKGDVVLYRRPPDKYVLHRIIKVRPADYVILGDNCINKEYGIKDRDIVGVMTGFVRNGKSYSINDTVYRVYTFFILNTVTVRIFFKKAKGKIRRICKKLLRR